MSLVTHEIVIVYRIVSNVKQKYRRPEDYQPLFMHFLVILPVECGTRVVKMVFIDRGATIVGNNGGSEANENWQHLDMNHLLVGGDSTFPCKERQPAILLFGSIEVLDLPHCGRPSGQEAPLAAGCPLSNNLILYLTR